MQNMHTVESTAGGGKLFAAAAGGDRRLRPLPHHQDLNCPRCESSNTKFCYYNNYNLSQPRHFCKSCRRYWTKGGVLRNVPVGGGVRKTKRSNKPKPKATLPSSDAAPSERRSSNSENSSSDSSSQTQTATTKTTATAKTTVTATTEVGTNSTPPMLLNFNEPDNRFFDLSTPVATFDPLILSQSSAGNMRSFTSLMTSSVDQLPSAFETAAGIPSFQLHQEKTECVVEDQNPDQFEWMQTEMGSSGFMDRTVEIELSGLESESRCRRSYGGPAGTEDWQDSVDEGLFDLTGTVDQSYWSQSQWNHDDDHHHHHHLNDLP